MQSFLLLLISALSLFASMSAAAPTPQPTDHKVRMLRRYVENEPSSMFSKRQLLEVPTRVKKTNKLAVRASTTATSYMYNVQILTTGGSVLGYLATNKDNNGYWTYTTSTTGALAVAAPTSSSSSNLLFAASGSNSVAAFVGSSSKSSTMGSSSYNYCQISDSSASTTNPGNNYSNSYEMGQGSSSTSETTIWQYTSSSSVLNAVWVNPDSSKFTMLGVVGASSKSVFLVGDRSAFAKQFTSDTYTAVTFKLTSIS